ncbi:MAG: ATP-binding protein [Pseudomonadales bacterium]
MKETVGILDSSELGSSAISYPLVDDTEDVSADYLKSDTNIPSNVVWGLVLVCILPFILYSLGVDFSNHGDQHPVADDATIDDLFYRLSGPFTHALLEWSAFTAALFTVVLAFSHYKISHDVTTPIIGVALFCAGCMDAFHTLAAARLIESVADNTNLIPFTWAVCRIFNALIMIAGVGIFLFRPRSEYKAGMGFIVVISLVFALVGYAIIHICATSESLPQTQFPDALITRPYDMVPLLLFLFAGLVIYPKFCKTHPSLFASALLLSAIPEVVVELHMALGSTQLFDSHFNMAHFLKIVAYIVPFIGLNLDYVRTYRRERQNYQQLTLVTKQLMQQKCAMAETNQKLKVSNAELEKFAYIASHDLQEPLRKVQAFGNRLHSKYGDVLDERGKDYLSRMQNASSRMSRLINDLLIFSRVQTLGKKMAATGLNPLVEACISDLQIAIEESNAVISHDNLPVIFGDKTQLEQLFRNLLINAIKFRHPKRSPVISIAYKGTESQGDIGMCHILEIHDNGIGLEQKYAKKIFEVFQRLHGNSEYEGSGIGLAVCRRIVTRHGGEINVKGELEKGCVFTISFPELNTLRLIDENRLENDETSNVITTNNEG